MHESTLTIVDDDHIEVKGTGWENGARREGDVLRDEACSKRNSANERVGGAAFIDPLGLGPPRSERLEIAIVDGVAAHRSAEANLKWHDRRTSRSTFRASCAPTATALSCAQSLGPKRARCTG